MGCAQTMRCSIRTLPFDKTHFSQFNTASADIIARCHFFSSRTEELPKVIALDHVLISLDVFHLDLRYRLWQCAGNLGIF